MIEPHKHGLATVELMLRNEDESLMPVRIFGRHYVTASMEWQPLRLLCTGKSAKYLAGKPSYNAVYNRPRCQKCFALSGIKEDRIA